MCPLDTAISVCLNKGPINEVNAYSYEGLDVSWVIIPVRQTQLAHSHIMPLLLAHLHSDYWAGTVTVTNLVTYRAHAPGGPGWLGQASTMPDANNVDIAGPRNIMLALVDCTMDSHPPTIMLGGLPYLVTTTRHGAKR